MKQRHLRLIIFIPAFFAYLVITQTICETIVKWSYSHTFPINGFSDFLFAAGVGIPLMFVPVLMFLGGIPWAISIAPNTRLASRIFLVIMLITYGFYYANSFSQISGWRILLDVLVFLMVLIEAIKQPNAASTDSNGQQEKAFQRPTTKIHSTDDTHQSEIEFAEDLRVIESFGRSLENLPADRLPTESDLEYPIKRIEEAIRRLKSSPRIKPHQLQAIHTGENFLQLYKGGS